MQAIQKAFMSFKSLEATKVVATVSDADSRALAELERKHREQAEARMREEAEEERQRNELRLQRQNTLKQLTSPVPSPDYEVALGTFNVIVCHSVKYDIPPLTMLAASWFCYYARKSTQPRNCHVVIPIVGSL